MSHHNRCKSTRKCCPPAKKKDKIIMPNKPPKIAFCGQKVEFSTGRRKCVQ